MTKRYGARERRGPKTRAARATSQAAWRRTSSPAPRESELLVAAMNEASLFTRTESGVQTAVEWLRLLIESLGALVIAARIMGVRTPTHSVRSRAVLRSACAELRQLRRNHSIQQRRSEWNFLPSRGTDQQCYCSVRPAPTRETSMRPAARRLSSASSRRPSARATLSS